MRTLRAGSQGLPGRRGGAAAKEKMQPEASRRRRCIRLHRILFYHIGKSGLSDKTFREDRHAAEGKMQPGHPAAGVVSGCTGYFFII